MKDKSHSLSPEDWLRKEGLGLLIPAARRFSRLPGAIGPFVVFALFLYGANSILSALILARVDASGNVVVADVSMQDALWVLGAVALLFSSLPIAVGYHFWCRRRKTTTKNVMCLVFILFFLLLGFVGGSDDGAERVFLLVGALAFSFLEGHSILYWAGRSVLRSISFLGPMISRVLPFLLLAQLLVFFTNEIWQLAASLSVAKLWAVNGVLLLPTLLLAVAQSQEGVRKSMSQPSVAADLDNSPFAGREPVRGQPLGLAERFNLLLLPSAAQFIQVLLFICLLCGFFVVFGMVALDPSLVKEWSGGPAEPLKIYGIRTPIDSTMFKVALILATFSGLSFVASNVTDKEYGEVFLGPIFAEVERGIAARNVYVEMRPVLSPGWGRKP